MRVAFSLLLLSSLPLLLLADGVVPKFQFIFQHGPPKTATTNQYNLLRAIVELKNPHHMYSAYVGSKWLPSNALRRAKIENITMVAKVHHCHSIWNLKKINSNPKNYHYRFAVFTTGTGNPCLASPAPMVTQDPAVLWKEGTPYIERQIRTEYKQIFDLTDEEVKMLIDFMWGYEPVRRCCGNQMSTGFAKYLKASGLKKLSIGPENHNEYYVRHGERRKIDVDHYCVGKNLTQMAWDYAQLPIVEKFGSLQTDYHKLCLEGEFMFRAGYNHKTNPIKHILPKILRDYFAHDARNGGVGHKKTNGFLWFDDEKVYNLLLEKMEKLFPEKVAAAKNGLSNSSYYEEEEEDDLAAERVDELLNDIVPEE